MNWLLVLCHRFPEILEVDLGASPGAKDDEDLDYEVLDKAGEYDHPTWISVASTPLSWDTGGMGRGSEGLGGADMQARQTRSLT